MASWIYLSACIIATIVFRQVSGTTLTITPSQVQIGGANPTALNGTCIPPTGTTAVYTITIGRKLHTALPGDTGLDMVQISSGVNNDEAEIKDGSLRSRLTVQGDITSASKILRFSLRDPTCNDIKDYAFFCRTLFIPATAGNSEAFQNVTYRVNPDNIRMVVFPNYEIYDPGTLVTFTCTGKIGSDFPTDQSQFWVWEWRDVSQVIPTSWIRYPYSNITYGNPTAAANCNNDGRSELRHTVSELDNGRQFRCYVVNPELYSGNATVYTEAMVTPGGPGEVDGGDPNTADVGMIVGIVIGVLAAIVIVVVLVYFLVFRRKSSGGDDYDTGEGKENGPEMVDNVVYTTPSSNKPHRGGKGRENDGLDEPHEKNPRPYYANDFGDRDRDRGRNNPAMDNDSRHDRSFDDDNTDSRMRSPYGSAV